MFNPVSILSLLTNTFLINLKFEILWCLNNCSIFRINTHHQVLYLCTMTFNNNDYSKRKS